MIYQCLMVVCVIGLHFALEWHCLRRNGQVYIIVPRCTTFTKPTQHIHLYMIHQCHIVVCVLGLYFTFEWPWLGRNCLDYMSILAGADPGIFVGGRGPTFRKNFEKPKKKRGGREGGFSLYSAIVRSKSIFAMVTALHTTFFMTYRDVFSRQNHIRSVCFSFVKNVSDFTRGGGFWGSSPQNFLV